jgi:hypothetical protein
MMNIWKNTCTLHAAVDAIVRQEVLQGPMVGIVLILVHYCKLPHGSLSTATIMAFSLEGAHTARRQQAFMCAIVLHFPPHGDTNPIVETQQWPDVNQDNTMHIPMEQYLLNHSKY